MKGFPLTKKRLLSQPEARRHRLIADWLKELYLNQTSGKLNHEETRLIVQQYQTAAY